MPSGERPFPALPPSLHPSIPCPLFSRHPMLPPPRLLAAVVPCASTHPPHRSHPPRLPTPLVTDRITSMPVPLHVRSHHTAASWGGGTRERPAPGWPPSRCAHTLPKQNPPGTRVHDIEACVCGYGLYTAGACSWGLGCPLLVKTARVACCEEWRCSSFVHRASSAPQCDSAR